MKQETGLPGIARYIRFQTKQTLSSKQKILIKGARKTRTRPSKTTKQTFFSKQKFSSRELGKQEPGQAKQQNKRF